MRELTVRIFGTGCFVDRRSGADRFQKRLILPVDDLADNTDKQFHVPYVEFPSDKITSGSGDLGEVYRRVGGVIRYQRFELARHIVAIEGIDDSTAFTVMQSYRDHVPQMKALAPGLRDRPRTECFADMPDGRIIAAFFDISHGILKASTLFEFVTRFKKSTGPINYRLQTTESVELLIPIKTDELSVTITAPSQSGPLVSRIVLDSTADVITIGNQPVLDIIGSGSGEDIDKHFRMYYNLCEDADKPTDPPLPIKEADPVNGCTDTNWP